MCRVWYDYLVPAVIASRPVVLLDAPDCCELSLGSGDRLKRDCVHSGADCQHLLHLVVDCQQALDLRRVLQGVDSVNPR